MLVRFQMKYSSIVPFDTTIDMFRAQLDISRRMSPESRLQQALQWSEQAWDLSRAGIRARHPDYSEREVELANIRLRIGDELFREVYPGIEVRP
jgi:hypothetical protein